MKKKCSKFAFIEWEVGGDVYDLLGPGSGGELESLHTSLHMGPRFCMKPSDEIIDMMFYSSSLVTMFWYRIWRKLLDLLLKRGEVTMLR